MGVLKSFDFLIGWKVGAIKATTRRIEVTFLNKFVAVVECAIEYQGEFLIIERPKGGHAEGLLSFPGGKIEITDGDDGEDVLVQAARREVYEEVGLKLEPPIRYVTSSCFIDTKTGDHIVDVIFHCKLETAPGELQVCPREVPCYFWLTREDLLRAPNSPDWLLQYLDKI